MEVTPAAAIILPLAAIAAFRRWWLLAFLVATAPLHTLSVVTFLSHEFPPSEIALLLLIGRQAISWLDQQRLVIGFGSIFRWFVLFGIVSLLSVVAAALFPSNVLVHPYNIGGFGGFEFKPVRFASENVTQLFLRLFFVVGVFAIADAIKDIKEIRKLFRWFVLTGVLVGAVGIVYQLSILVDFPIVTPLRWIGFDRFVNNPARVGPLPRMYSLPGEPGFTGDYLLYAFALSVTGLICCVE